MIPNLKVDIIYYNTQSDFEMEFNLSGYCRMRIFKTSATTSEELISALATDLDRSQIIMVVTDVLGNESGVKTVSESISFELEPVNKEENHISASEEILIPKGAVPLVSNSGAFGGCILESGEQSIIMITNNRALRHEIMKSLVHQYIFDVSQLEVYKKRQQFKPPVLVEEVKIVEEVEEKSDSDKTEITPPTPSLETNINNSIFSAPGTNLVMTPPQAEEIVEDETTVQEKKPKAKPKKKKVTDILLLIIVVLLLIAFGIMAYFFVYIPLVNGSLSLGSSDNGIINAIESWLFN